MIKIKKSPEHLLVYIDIFKIYFLLIIKILLHLYGCQLRVFTVEADKPKSLP